MLVKTESDGDFSTVTIEDSGKNFTYELKIQNNADGSCKVWWESNRTSYNLLTVEADGRITNETPTLE
jgi:hypothetical protein